MVHPDYSERQIGVGAGAGILLGVTVVTWLILAFPAYLVAGYAGLNGLTLSACLCFCPGVLVVWMVLRIPPSPERALVVLVGTGVRFLTVAMTVLVFSKLWPGLNWPRFYSWLVIFYNVLLLVESILVLPRHSNFKRSPLS